MSTISEDDCDILAVGEVDKKKLKKWRKRVETGQANSSIAYIMAKYKCNLPASPTIELTAEGTKSNSKSGLALSELRNVMLSVLEDRHIQNRYFQIANKGFIRYIVHIHVEDADDGRSVLQGLRAPEVIKIKISQERDRLSYLPYKLLTQSLTEGGKAAPAPSLPKTSDIDTNAQGTMYDVLNPLVLSMSTKKLWNYPLPCEESQGNEEQKVSAAHSTTPPSFPATKKRRIDLSNSPGNFQNSTASTEDAYLSYSQASLPPHLPCAEAAEQLLGCVGLVRGWRYTDFPACLSREYDDKYVQSVHLQSEQYGHIWAGAARRPRPYRVLALDCEMLKTDRGVEVCRVSLLSPSEEAEEENGVEDEAGLVGTEMYRGCRVVCDFLVRPQGRVVDYCTTYTNITADTYAQTCSITYAQLIVYLLRHLHSECILIGHSLDSDLYALKYLHPCCVDSAILFPHARGYPLRNKLKALAKQYLHLDIQMTHPSGGKESSAAVVRGHDPREDAYAALMLVIARGEGGEGWGLPAHRQRSSVFRRGKGGRAVLLKRVERLADGKAAAEEVQEDNDKDSGRTDVALDSNGGGRWGFSESIEDALYGGEGELVHVEGRPGDVTACVVKEVRAFEKAEGERLRAQYGKEKKDAIARAELPNTLFLSASLRYKDETTLGLIKALREELKVQEEAGGEGAIVDNSERGLLVVTAQSSDARVCELSKKRHLSSRHPLSAVCWSADLERELREEISKSNSGFAALFTL